MSKNAKRARSSTLILLLAIFVILAVTCAASLDTPALAATQPPEYLGIANEYFALYLPESIPTTSVLYRSDPQSTDTADYFRLVISNSDYTSVKYRVKGEGAYITPTTGTLDSGVTCHYVGIFYNLEYEFLLSSPDPDISDEPIFHTFSCFDFVAPTVVDNSLDPVNRKVTIRDASSNGQNISMGGLKSVKIYTAEHVFYDNTALGGIGVYEYNIDFGDTKDVGFLSDVYIRIEDVVGHVTTKLLWQKIETSEYTSYMGLKDTLEAYIAYKDDGGMGLSAALIARLESALEELETSYAATGIGVLSQQSKDAMALANAYVNEEGGLDDCITFDVEESITLPSTAASYYYADVKYGDEIVLTISSVDLPNDNDNIASSRVRIYTVTFTVNGVAVPFSNGVSIYCAFSGAEDAVAVTRDIQSIDMHKSSSGWVRYTINEPGTYSVYYGALSSPTPWWVWLLVSLGGVIVIGAVAVVVVVVIRRRKVAIVHDSSDMPIDRQ